MLSFASGWLEQPYEQCGARLDAESGSGGPARGPSTNPGTDPSTGLSIKKALTIR
ncbi:hypothetical protein GCM10010431_84080 [Streptomyces kunmingensis]